MSYVTISIRCPWCGEPDKREMDEEVMPSTLRCRQCGARIPIEAEPMPRRAMVGSDSAEGGRHSLHDLAHHHPAV